MNNAWNSFKLKLLNLGIKLLLSSGLLFLINVTIEHLIKDLVADLFPEQSGFKFYLLLGVAFVLFAYLFDTIILPLYRILSKKLKVVKTNDSVSS